LADERVTILGEKMRQKHFPHRRFVGSDAVLAAKGFRPNHRTGCQIADPVAPPQRIEDVGKRSV
jgi:hypothetical protein